VARALVGVIAILLIGWATRNASAAAPPPLFIDDLELHGLEPALDKSLAHLRILPAATRFRVADTTIPVGRLIDSIHRLRTLIQANPDPEKLHRQILEHFTVWTVHGRPDDESLSARRMLITGYYQPVFAGSLSRHPPYLYPLYREPDDLLVREQAGQRNVLGRKENGRIVPYWSRREIEQANLLRGMEMVWLKDPFDAFMLHVQGSGIIRLVDGSLRGVHYARSNGREYRSIGKYLVDTGRMRLADVTMDSIRSYIDQHPDERDLILRQNDSFIFFHWREPGPALGSLNQVLTAGRSVAADQQWYPPGSLLFLDSRRPIMKEGGAVGWQRMRRFVTVQDTGSALKGPRRIDVFWGTGEQAGWEAGQMKEEGVAYLLLLKEGGAP